MIPSEEKYKKASPLFTFSAINFFLKKQGSVIGDNVWMLNLPLCPRLLIEEKGEFKTLRLLEFI
jgi:hypothetical protein